MNVVFLFPGQGSQVPGMLHALPDHPTISRTLDEVSETLKQNVLPTRLARDSSVNGFSPIGIAGLWCRAGTHSHRQRCRARGNGGHVRGTFSAAVTAGVLEPADGVRLLRRPAERMLELYPKGYGLAAIVGLTEKQVTTGARRIYGAGPSVRS